MAKSWSDIRTLNAASLAVGSKGVSAGALEVGGDLGIAKCIKGSHLYANHQIKGAYNEGGPHTCP